MPGNLYSNLSYSRTTSTPHSRQKEDRGLPVRIRAAEALSPALPMRRAGAEARAGGPPDSAAAAADATTSSRLMGCGGCVGCGDCAFKCSVALIKANKPSSSITFVPLSFACTTFDQILTSSNKSHIDASPTQFTACNLDGRHARYRQHVIVKLSASVMV